MISYLISRSAGISKALHNLYMISLCVWCVAVETLFDFMRVLCERVVCALDKVELYPLLSSKRTDYVRFAVNSTSFAPILNKTLVSNVHTVNRNTESFALARSTHTRNTHVTLCTRENSPFP